MSRRVGLVVTAAGDSRRFGGTSKQFYPILGRPLLAHTLACFQNISQIEEAVVVAPADQLGQTQDVIDSVGLPFPVEVVAGGQTRRRSVEIGVRRLKGLDWVMIHDGARPNVSSKLLGRLLGVDVSVKAVIPGVGISDTVKRVQDGIVVETIPRETLVGVQTPQLFETRMLVGAYERFPESDVTDEAGLVEALGDDVHVVAGEVGNIKVTFPSDVGVLESWWGGADPG